MTAISNELREAAMRYIELEARIGEAVTAICLPVCRACTDCCCAVRFCVESIESEWLRTIAAVSGHSSGEYDRSNGWLSPQGCRLRFGRPPVCYEFFCEAIMRAEEDPLRRNALKVLGRVLGSAGKRAIGDRHLITLSRFDLCNRLRPDKLLKRIESSEGTVSECMEVLRTGTGRLGALTPDHVAIMKAV